jgi:nucleoside-diphosphate-sugar epimerase
MMTTHSQDTVLVTGAAGFIGGHIVKTFVQEGWHVIALVHRQSSPLLAALAATGQITLLPGDTTNGPELSGKLKPLLAQRGKTLSVIVHCAGRASDVGRDREFRRTNYEATQAMVRLAQEFAVDRFVFISTTDVYGMRDHQGGQEDEIPLRPYPANSYPKYKLLSEQHIRETLPQARYCLIRPAQVWGVGDTTLTPRIVEFLKLSPVIIHFGRWQGRNRWPLAHVDNVAMATFLGAIRPEAAGLAINVVDNEITTMEEFYRLLAALTLPHKRFRSITLPFALGQAFGLTVSAISNLLNLNRPFTDPSHYALYAVSRNLDFGNARMRELFRLAGKSLRTRAEGLAELRADFEKHH